MASNNNSEWSSQLQNILEKITSSLGDSLDGVVNITDDVRHRISELKVNRQKLQQEISEVIATNDEVSSAYWKARVNLANASTKQDEPGQAKSYEEAEHFMKLRGSLEERERNLRRMRDEVDVDNLRMERILARAEEMINKMRLVMDILKSRIDDMMPDTSVKDNKILALALRFMERENMRMARDIHDGPAQHFAGAILIADQIKRSVESGDSVQASGEISKLKEQLGDAVLEFRTMLQRLKPVGLDVSLEKGVKRMAEVMSDRYDVEISVIFQGLGGDNMSRMGRANVFRIIQEAVINAIRHGKSKKIRIAGSFGKEVCTFRISDDGVGFDLDTEIAKANERGSYGLSNMTERVQFTGGTIKIDSTPGRGTSVTVSVPSKEYEQ